MTIIDIVLRWMSVFLLPTLSADVGIELLRMTVFDGVFSGAMSTYTSQLTLTANVHHLKLMLDMSIAVYKPYPQMVEAMVAFGAR